LDAFSAKFATPLAGAPTEFVADRIRQCRFRRGGAQSDGKPPDALV